VLEYPPPPILGQTRPGWPVPQVEPTPAAPNSIKMGVDAVLFIVATLLSLHIADGEFQYS